MYLDYHLTIRLSSIDLREDKHYLSDHPGLVPVTTAQVCVRIMCFCLLVFYFFSYNIKMMMSIHNQGEELRKQIGATYYIECSSKTQQVAVNSF